MTDDNIYSNIPRELRYNVNNDCNVYTRGTFFNIVIYFNQQVVRLRERVQCTEWRQWRVNRCRASRLSTWTTRGRRVARASRRSLSNPETRCRSADARRHRFCRHAAAAEPVSVSPPSPEPGSRQTHAASGAPSARIGHVVAAAAATITTTTTAGLVLLQRPRSATKNRYFFYNIIIFNNNNNILYNINIIVVIISQWYSPRALRRSFVYWLPPIQYSVAHTCTPPGPGL